ncbi:MAG TPA: FAD-binding protein [Polyangiaceae bacterium]|nr:FAD-binding protein [Polyangiaceae bacterium]
MRHAITRRSLLSGIAATVVIGFDPVRKSWVTAAAASPDGSAPSLLPVPQLDGVLRTDPPTLDAAGDDFGHTIHREPIAVLEAGSIEDIVKMVDYARRHDLTIVNRGQGHSTFGQSQTRGGIVVDSSAGTTLRTIHSVGHDRIEVGPGARWREVIDASLAHGLTPPTIPDYLDLSVGGTLSIAGVGGESHRHGLQIDNVLALEVVTGTGARRTCSDTEHPALFEAVLGGLGQFALITRATIRLVAAPSMARVYNLTYDNLSTFIRDAHTLALDERFSHLEGQASANPGGGWTWVLFATSYFTPPATPNDAALLAGLSDRASSRQIQDVPYPAFLARIDPLIEAQKQSGTWFQPHPWFDVFLSSSVTTKYVDGILDHLTVDDTGGGPILLYPMRRSKLRRPFFRAPDEEVFFLFDLLYNTRPDPNLLESKIRLNRRFYERARDIGGTRYCFNSIPFSHEDWKRHFGVVWPAFALSKAAFDPENVLTPGPGIFR